MNPRGISLLVGGYAFVGSLYILFSDAILFRLFPTLSAAFHIGLIKGLGFIALTSAVLAWLLQRMRATEHARYSDLFAHHRAVMFLVDPDSGCILDATPDAERFYGLSRQQLLVRKIAELEDPPADGQRVNWRGVLSGEIGTCHCRQLAAAGEVRDVLLHTGPIVHEGQVLRVIIVQDETARMRLLDQLETAEMRWRFALEGAGHGMWEWEVPAGRVYYSHHWKSMLGYADGDIGDSISEWETRVHPEDLPAAKVAIEAHFSGRAPMYRSEQRLRCKDGTWKWVLDQGQITHRDADGKPLRVIGTHTDINEQKHQQQALRENEARYRELFAGNPHPMWVYDKDTLAFIAVNDAAVSAYGYSREEFLAMTIRDIRPPDDVPRLMGVLARNGRAFEHSGIWRHLRKDGTPLDVEITSHVLDFDHRSAVLVLAHDVTAQLRAEETIKDYVNRLEAAILGTAAAVAQMVELRDPYTAGHERRVGELSAAIAAELGLDDSMQRGLRVAGAMHDVGKIMVPVEILTRPGRLSALEMELVKQHAQQGYEVLKDVAFPWPVAEVARQHHERMDGSGYPRGLKNGEIILEARIMAVADVVESMASHRPYRAGLGTGAALAEIEANAGRLYDAEVCAACLRLFRDKGYQIPD